MTNCLQTKFDGVYRSQQVAYWMACQQISGENCLRILLWIGLQLGIHNHGKV